MTSGIYQIKNTLNGKVYIGSSKVYESRKWHHINELRRGVHHSSKLQHAWNKYGEESFIFEVVEICEDITALCPREQVWMDLLQAYSNGYNIRPTAESNRGYHPSEETKAKIKRGVLARTISDEERQRMSERATARNLARGPQPEEVKRKISLSHAGLKHTEESKAKMRGRVSPFKGSSHSEESKSLIRAARAKQEITPEHVAKVAESNRGKKRTPEQCQRFSEAQMGHVCSEETRKKISETKLRKNMLTP